MRFRNSLWLAASLLVLAGCDVFTDSNARITRAEQRFAEGAYSEAMVELRNALEERPSDARALLLLAKTNLQLGRYEPAAQALDSAEKSGASAADLAPTRARLMLARGAYAELATALSSGTLPLDAGTRDSFLARAWSAQDRCDQALPLAREGLAREAKQPELRLVVVECLGRRGNSAGALRELDTAVREVPDDASLWLARGRVQQALGDKRAAAESWSRAAELAPGKLGIPQQAMMYSSLADIQVEAGDVAGVRRTHQALLTIAPGSPITSLLEAQLALLEGKSEAAVAAAQRLVGANGEINAARVLLVSALLAQGTVEQARQQLALLLGKEPKASNLKVANDLIGTLKPADENTASYWVRLAAAQNALGQPAVATGALERALKIAPEDPAAATALAGLELRMGRAEAAATRARELVRKFPDNPAALAVLADALAAQGDHAQSAATLDSLYAKTPSAATAVAAHRVRTAGKLGGENRLLQQWLVWQPADASIRAVYAESLRAAGDHRGAAAEFETLVAAQPRNPVALNNLAWTYHVLGDPRALPTAARAYEVAPKAAAVADTYGWLKVQAGALDEGLKVLKAADELAGARVPEIRYHYAVALARSGDSRQARSLLEDLLANGGDWDGVEQARSLLQSLPAGNAT